MVGVVGIIRAPPGYSRRSINLRPSFVLDPVGYVFGGGGSMALVCIGTSTRDVRRCPRRFTRIRVAFVSLVRPFF